MPKSFKNRVGNKINFNTMKTNEELKESELREINGGCMPGNGYSVIENGPISPKIPRPSDPDYWDWILGRIEY